MLAIPQSGMSLSVSKHNSDLSIFCDWLEGSVVFDTDEVSQSDAVDGLINGKIYRSQDYAKEQYAFALKELRRRAKYAGNALAWRLDGSTLRRTHRWDERPAHSFCLALALAAGYRDWARSFGKNYTSQGALFERLVEESLHALGWDVLRTGWGGASHKKLHSVSWLGEPLGSSQEWTSESANEAGTDLVCFRPFSDRRPGVPLYLLQCASGVGWEDRKQHAPDLNIWFKLLDFTTDPRKGFALPFALDQDPFRIAARKTNGLLLDRIRILSAPGASAGWVSKSLAADIVKWLKPRISSLPTDS